MYFRRTLLLCLILNSIFCCADNFDLPCRQPGMLLRILKRNHFSPQELNLKTEKAVFNNFIQRIDPEGNIFTIQQYDSLLLFVPGILDTNKQQSCIFLRKVCEVYRLRIINADSLVSKIGRKSFQFSSVDSVYFDSKKKVTFAKSESDLEKRRNSQLKFYFLNELFSSMDDDKNVSDNLNKLLRDKEVGIRVKLIQSEKCFLRKKLSPPEGFVNSVTSDFLKAIAYTFDPHSEYFSISDQKEFSAELSAKAGSFGFKIISKEGKLFISKLVPGGPAWKSNIIHSGDELIKVATSKTKLSDLICLEAYEVESLINNSQDNWVELELKGKDGNVQKIKLVKELMQVEDNRVNSCIFKGGINVGYLSLPDFYTSGEFSDGPGCANDVAKEILKLQKSGIQGLILDLRFNGGGSIEEAINLAGLFIDAGPLAILKSKETKPFVLKDMNRGIAYGGNVVLMVNGSSASATELVAGILQDYNRAVIVGQPTYGKATGQVVLPMNEIQLKDYGFIKVTIEKIYRLNGESNQIRGVIPDIKIPDLFDEVLQREGDESSVLQRDTINKKIVYPSLPFLPIEKLKMNSNERVRNSKGFTKLSEKNNYLKEFYNQKVMLTLEPMAVFKWLNETQELFNDKMEIENKGNSVFKVENNSFDKSLMEVDEFRRDFINTNNEHILNDIQIIEAYSILKDLILFNH